MGLILHVLHLHAHFVLSPRCMVVSFKHDAGPLPPRLRRNLHWHEKQHAAWFRRSTARDPVTETLATACGTDNVLLCLARLAGDLPIRISKLVLCPCSGSHRGLLGSLLLFLGCTACLGVRTQSSGDPWAGMPCVDSNGFTSRLFHFR